MPEIEIIDHTEQPVAVVRSVVLVDAMPDFFGRSYHALMEELAKQGSQIAGPPFARYYGMPSDTVDLEAGFPVAAPINASGDVQPASLPAGRCYEATHVGPYDTLVETYSRVLQQMEADGATPSDVMWEYYLSDPEEEPDPAKWQTRVCWPVAG